MNKNSGMLDYFSLLVIGDNPDDKIYEFDMSSFVDKSYILYSYSDVNKLRKNRIKFYKEYLNYMTNIKDINSIKEQIDTLEKTTDLDYYYSLGDLYSFDENKNIVSTENPKGKWITCEKADKIFNDYLKDFNGNGVLSTKKNKIDWSLIHLNQQKCDLYSKTWDLCVDNVEPSNEKEVIIKKNMKVYLPYFKKYKNKDEYVRYSTSFWSYAIIDEKGNWTDMEYCDEFEWVNTFYDEKDIIIYLKNYVCF